MHQALSQSKWFWQGQRSPIFSAMEARVVWCCHLCFVRTCIICLNHLFLLEWNFFANGSDLNSPLDVMAWNIFNLIRLWSWTPGLLDPLCPWQGHSSPVSCPWTLKIKSLYPSRLFISSVFDWFCLLAKKSFRRTSAKWKAAFWFLQVVISPHTQLKMWFGVFFFCFFVFVTSASLLLLLLTLPSLPPSPLQDEWGDVRHPAAVGHRADVRAASRHDEAAPAGLPQPGSEGRGPDEEGGGAD